MNTLQLNLVVGDTVNISVNNGVSGKNDWYANPNSGTGTFTPQNYLNQSGTSYGYSPAVLFTSTGTGGGSTYEIFVYHLSFNPTRYRSGRIVGTITAAAASFSLTAPATVLEGTSGTITAPASNHTAGVYYWNVTPSADFTTNQGSIYIPSSGSRTFTVTPTADGVTEGNETATVRLFSNSARTIQVASTTFTITDAASSGGGGGSTGGGTSGGSTNQGINVFSPNGTKVFGTDLRTQNIQHSYQESVGAGATSTTKTMADANNTGKVLIVILGYYQPGDYTINTSSTGFNITNNTGGTRTIDVLALRIG